MAAQPACAGIDYSTKAVDLAVVRGKEVVFLRRVELGADVGPQLGVLLLALSELKSHDPVGLWLEQPWFGFARPNKNSPMRSSKATLQLHTIAHRCETVALQCGIEVHFVAVNTWRHTVLGDGRMKTAVAKEAAMNYARWYYGADCEGHNAADAVCLAAYGQAVSRLSNASR